MGAPQQESLKDIWHCQQQQQCCSAQLDFSELPMLKMHLGPQQ